MLYDSLVLWRVILEGCGVEVVWKPREIRSGMYFILGDREGLGQGSSPRCSGIALGEPGRSHRENTLGSEPVYCGGP